MQPNPMHPTPTGFTGYVSGHRFGLTMLACALVLVVELLAVYGSVGFTPIWASHTITGAV
ncbi:MAG: hypothetical protein ACJ8H8_10475 [Geminicoccaceae bacterium]